MEILRKKVNKSRETPGKESYLERNCEFNLVLSCYALLLR